MSISQPIPYMLSEDRVRNGRTHLLNFGSIKPISNSTILRTKLYFTDYRNKIRQTENVSYFMTDTTLIRSTKETNILNDKELGASILLKTDGENISFPMSLSILHNGNVVEISSKEIITTLQIFIQIYII